MATTQENHHPSWLQAVMREASVRRCLVLYGHVRDVFYDPQERGYVTLPELLTRIIMRERAAGFTLVGRWDQVDGLRFPDARMTQRFHGAVQQGTANGASHAAAGGAYEIAGSNTPARREETPANGLYPNPNELLPAIRQVFTNDAERPVFILDWSQLLVGQASHLDTDERRWMLHLGKCLVGQPNVPMDSDHLRHGSGLIVLLTTNLGTVPPIFYQGEPRVRLIPIPAPTRPERKAFFQRHFDDLRCERPKPAAAANPVIAAGSNRDELADTLADLTDQFDLVDLRQILGLSMRTETPLAPERLFNLYRFGDQRSPWEEISRDKLKTIEQSLKKRVIGQDPAVQHVATMAIRAFMGLAGLQHSARRAKPKGSLFFVGPTGVGKTELAKALAEFLFGDETACIRFDMSEFSQEHSDQRLIGAPPGYVGFEEGGQLTNAVRERPFCVLLFDEIEKAHPRILDKFLQILEDGRLTDGRGETTYFSECVIIFTSNLGAASEMPKDADPDSIRLHFIRAVENHFVRQLQRPELLNRLGDNVVVFYPIVNNDIRRSIMARKISPLQDNLLERFGISFRISPELETSCLESARVDHNGRGMVNALEQRLLNTLAWFLFDHEHQLRRGRTIDASLADGKVVYQIEEA